MLVKQDNIIIDYDNCGIESPATTPTITSYILENDGIYRDTRRPAVIICPGGGYTHLASHEGEPTALQFNAAGFHAFVLHYSLYPTRFPAALMELSMAVAMVRGGAEKYNIDPNRIIVCGFSAGGHLVASLGSYWHEGFVQRALGFDNNENQPNGMILCYPVITNKQGLAHLGSIQALFGKYPDEKEIAMFAVEDNVNEFTPPAFIWHTYEDSCVPLENSMLYASALRKKEIPFELHIYQHGDHGIGLANEVTSQFPRQIVLECQNWIDMAIQFIKNI